MRAITPRRTLAIWGPLVCLTVVAYMLRIFPREERSSGPISSSPAETAPGGEDPIAEPLRAVVSEESERRVVPISDPRPRADQGAAPPDAVLACLLLQEPEAVQWCLHDLPLDLSNEDLVGYFCTPPDGVSLASCWVLLRSVLLQSDPSDALARLSTLDGTCDSLAPSSGPVSRLLLGLRIEEPEWFNGLVDAITATGIAGEAESAYGTRLVGMLVRGGAEELRFLIDDCALGAGGRATREQMQVALLHSALVREDPSERLRFLHQVRTSPFLADRPRVAGTLANALLRGESWPDGRPDEALAAVREILHDEKLRADVAAHLWVNFREDPPAGIPTAEWAAIWEQVLDMAQSRGWSR